MAGQRFQIAAKNFQRAVDTNNRGELRETRELLMNVSADGDVDAAELARVATQLLESDSPAVGAGECQEADPFAPAYIVIAHGKAVWRCQHDPSHDVPA